MYMSFGHCGALKKSAESANHFLIKICQTAGMHTPEELLADDRFVDWVLSDGKLHAAYWQAWIQEKQERAALVEDARAMVRELQHSSPQETLDVDAAWQRLQSSIQPAPRLSARKHWWKIAATVALLLAAGWWFRPDSNHYETAYGELQQIELPDGTTVDLRANSALWWDGDWAEQGTREVFLKGEAYFQVTPASSQNGMAFVVHAKPLDVRVLGTSFNLVNRTDNAALTLVEGKVAIEAGQQQKTIVQPHQQYTWHENAQNGQLQDVVSPERYASWRQSVWHFEQTPLRDIAQQLQDNYGKTVIFQDTQLAEKTLSGSAPAKTLPGLVKGIAASLSLRVEVMADQIVFSR